MDWNVTVVDVTAPAAKQQLLAYFAELCHRYYGRPSPPAEVAAAMDEEPSDDLAPPTGLFLLASYRGQAAGCVGLRLVSAGLAEISRLYIRPERRGTGGGAALLAAVEGEARLLGVRELRMDTRSDLVEARALYARQGYLEVPAFNEGPYSDHWFGKRLV